MKLKKQINNRIFSLALALVMLMGMLPLTAYAKSNTKDFALLSHSKVPYYDGTTDDKFVFEGGFTVQALAGRCVRNYRVNHEHETTVIDASLELDDNNTLTFCMTYSIECNGTPYEITNTTIFENFSCENLTDSFEWSDDVAAGEYMVTSTVWLGREAGHSGTEATCITPAACTVCGENYINANNHEKPGEFSYSLNAADSTKHDKKYACCGGFVESMVHSGFTYCASGNVLTKTCGICSHAATATLTAGNAVYTGAPITTGASIAYDEGWVGDEPQPAAGDYSSNTNAGTATVTTVVEGKALTTSFKINAADITGATVTLNPASGTYNGTQQEPAISVVWQGAPLTENTDYTLSWNKSGFTNADTYTATITGTGNFTGTRTSPFTISPTAIKDAIITLEDYLFVYDGQPHKPMAVVTFHDITLTAGVDYDLYYIDSDQVNGWENGEPVRFFGNTSADSINAGQYYAVAIGKGNFSADHRFAYVPYTIEKATVTEPTIANKTYNKTVQTADIADADLYTVEQNNGGKNAGNYDVVLKLKDSANYKWSTTDNAEVTLQFKITQARNAWVTAPSISGWTYGEAANAPTAEAKFGAVYVLYDGTANDGTTYNGDTPPTKAGSYVARFFVDEAANYEPIGEGVEFIIAKADQAAPAGVGKTDETISKKSDGKITGVTAKMEYRKEGESTYTAITGNTVENLSAGRYFVRVKGDSNHNPSPDTAITVEAGSKLKINVPQNQVGYTLTSDVYVFDYLGNATLTFILKEGYSKGEDFKIILNGNSGGLWNKGQLPLSGIYTDVNIVVEGIADITPPAAEIKVTDNHWSSFWNNLTFGLFFKETQDVAITATDKGSGVKNIQYYLSDRELEKHDVEAITDWVDYNGTFKINPDNQYVVYAKITDHDGNVTHINSEGMVLDATAPIIEGIENGKTYYTTQKVAITEKHVDTITLNGDPVTDNITLDGNKDATYTIVVTDKAGNSTTVTVTMKPIKALAVAMENLTSGNVTSDDKDDLETLLADINKQLASTNLTENETKALEDAKKTAEGLLDAIKKAAEVTKTESIQKVEDVTSENVTPEDKTDLETAKADLEKALAVMVGNYTEDEKKAIQDEIKRIEDALNVIGNVAQVEERIDKLPDTITKDDASAINAAEDAYNALTDYEKSLVDEDAKKALDDAKTALNELNKPVVDPDNPQTGDNSNIALWLALLFISGGAVITLTVVDRKERRTAKH